MLYNEKKSSFNIGSGIVGTLVVIGAVIVYAIVSVLLGRLFITLRLGDAVGGGLSTAWLIGVAIAFVLYEAVFIVWQVKLVTVASGRADGGKMTRIFKTVLLSCLAASFAVALFTANTFTEIREDSISKVCFVTTEEYRWDKYDNDVSGYSLECDASGSLGFTVYMKDQTEIALFDHLNTLTDSFKEKYDTDSVALLAYAAHLADRFDESGNVIEKKIIGKEHMEKLYNTDEQAEKWAYLDKIIN